MDRNVADPSPATGLVPPAASERPSGARRREHGDVVGFAAYGTFRGAGKWQGYRFTVEHTIHVREARWGAGVGKTLLRELINRARNAGIHVMVGAIDADNIASIRFHESQGFSVVARMPEVGYKFERRLDLVLMQRILDPAT